jgi:tyrosinase
MTFTRRNAWDNGGTFDNPDLLWYARAVGVMKSRPVEDPTSWWFYAAIHNEYLDRPAPPGYTYLKWQNIASLPQNQLKVLPPQSQRDTFWRQCTHSSWFFLPWHRGYLAALENLLRDIIVNELKGPSDWALPYWNYLKVKEEQNQVPPAFKQEKLDGVPNPLFVPERYGNNFSDLNDNCQAETDFSKYGGLPNSYGAIENNPHGLGHDDIGGNNGTQDGIMGHVPTAALDPIFYLHHCNIDRMWAAWNKNGNSNPTDYNWLNSINPPKPFTMPMDSKGTQWNYISQDVTTTSIKYYQGVIYEFTYDDLSLFSDSSVAALGSQEVLALRLNKLKPGIDTNALAKITMDPNAELVGASLNPLEIKSGRSETKIKLDQNSWQNVSKSLLAASADNIPDEVYLQLEGVKGTEEGNALSIFVNQELVEKVSLFGLYVESLPDSHHGGAGLTFRINITSIVDKLHLEKSLDVSDLDVQVETKRPLQTDGNLSIERISVYRVGK